MCYSGKCRWEDHMGDCKFPSHIKVREIYPLPLCDIPESKEEVEYLNKAYIDIQRILSENL